MKTRSFSLATIAVAALFLSEYAQEKPDAVVKVDTQLVNIPVIVSDRDNRYIPGLTKDNFKIFQDGSEQKIEVFGNQQAPMSIVLALDTSLSTTDVLGKIKKAAREFVNDLDASDRCMIVSFGFGVNKLSNLTAEKDELNSAIKHAKIGKTPGTALNDAVYDAVASTLRPIKGRKAVVLLTDGKDFGSDHKQTDLLDRLAESDTVVYPIFYETADAVGARRPGPFPRMGRKRGRFPGGGMGRGGGGRRNWPSGRKNTDDTNLDAEEFLQQLADITGGRLFDQKKSDLPDAFRQIADEMKRQYLIGFYPPDERQGGLLHQVKVKVDRPDASVRSKSEYRTQAK